MKNLLYLVNPMDKLQKWEIKWGKFEIGQGYEGVTQLSSL